MASFARDSVLLNQVLGDIEQVTFDADPIYHIPDARIPFHLRSYRGRVGSLVTRGYLEECYEIFSPLSSESFNVLYGAVQGRDSIRPKRLDPGYLYPKSEILEPVMEGKRVVGSKLVQRYVPFCGNFINRNGDFLITEIFSVDNSEHIQSMALPDDASSPTGLYDVFSRRNEPVEITWPYDEYAKIEWQVLKQCMLERGYTAGDIKAVKKAFVVAKEAFRGQLRRNGRYTLEHSIDVARLILESSFSSNEDGSPCADDLIDGLLHDVVEDSTIWKPRHKRYSTTNERNEIAFEFLKNKFNERIGSHVVFLSKDLYQTDPPSPEDKLRVDSEFVARFKQPNLPLIILVVKLADRYCNLMTMNTGDFPRLQRQLLETYSLLLSINEGFSSHPSKGVMGVKNLLKLQAQAFSYIHDALMESLSANRDKNLKLEI